MKEPRYNLGQSFAEHAKKVRKGQRIWIRTANGFCSRRAKFSDSVYLYRVGFALSIDREEVECTTQN